MRKRIISVGLCLAVIAQMNYTVQAQASNFYTTSNLIELGQITDSTDNVDSSEVSDIKDISSQIRTELDSSFSVDAVSSSAISLLSNSIQYAGYAVTKDITVSSYDWDYEEDVQYRINIGNSSKMTISYSTSTGGYNSTFDFENGLDSNGKPYSKDSVYIFTGKDLKLLLKGEYTISLKFFGSDGTVLGTDSISVVCNLDNSYPEITSVSSSPLRYGEDLVLKLKDGTGFLSLYNNPSNEECNLKVRFGAYDIDITPYIKGDTITIPSRDLSNFKINLIDKSTTGTLSFDLDFKTSSYSIRYNINIFSLYRTKKPTFDTDITDTVISRTSSYIGFSNGSGEGLVSKVKMDINGNSETLSVSDSQTSLKIPSSLLSGYNLGDTLNITLTCDDYFKTTKTYSIPYNIPSDASLPSSVDVVYGEDTVIAYGGNPVDELEVRECYAYLGTNLIQFNFEDYGGYFKIPASEITRLKLQGYMDWTNANPELNVSIRAKDGTYRYLTTTLNVYDTAQPDMIEDTVYMTRKDEVYCPSYTDGLGECKVGSKSEPFYYIGSLIVSELSYSALKEAGLTYGETYTVCMDTGSVTGGSLIFNLYYGISEQGYFTEDVNTYVWGEPLKLNYNTGTGRTYISKIPKLYINGVSVSFTYRSGVITVPFTAIQNLRKNNPTLRTLSKYQVTATCTDTWGSGAYDIRTAVNIDVPVLPELSVSSSIAWKGEDITIPVSDGNMDEQTSSVSAYINDSLVGSYTVEDSKVVISSSDILESGIDFKYNSDYRLKLICNNLSETSFDSVLSYQVPRSPSSILTIDSSVDSSNDSLIFNIDMGDGDLGATGVSELRIDDYAISDFKLTGDTIIIASSALQDFRDNGGTRDKSTHEISLVLNDVNSSIVTGVFDMYTSELPALSESIGSYSFGSGQSLVFEYTDGTGDDKVSGISSIRIGNKIITEGITCFDGIVTVKASSLDGISYTELSDLDIVVVFDNRYNQALSTSLYIEEDSIEPSYTGGTLHLIESDSLDISIDEGRNKLKMTNIKEISLDSYKSVKGISYTSNVLTLSSEFFEDIKSQQSDIYKESDHILNLVLETGIKDVTLSVPLSITETYNPSVITRSINLTDSNPSSIINLDWGSGAELADNISSVKLDGNNLDIDYYSLNEGNLVLFLPEDTEYNSSHIVSVEFNNKSKTSNDLEVLYQVSREPSKLVSDPIIYTGVGDIEIAYDLGSGSKKINGIKEISLGGRVLDSSSYFLDDSSIIISSSAIKSLSSNLVFGETYDLNIVFDNNKEDVFSFVYNEHRVPSIDDSSLLYTGGDLFIPVDLGSGKYESVGVSSIYVNNNKAPVDAFFVSNGNIIISEEFIQSIVSGMLKGESQGFVVEFNNSEGTKVIGSFIYSMDRSPSLEEDSISYSENDDLVIPIDFGSEGERPDNVSIDGVSVPDGSWSITDDSIVVSKDYIESLRKENSFNIKFDHDISISFGNSLELESNFIIPVIEILPHIKTPTITIDSLDQGIDISYDLGFGTSASDGISSIEVDSIVLDNSSFTITDENLHIDLGIISKDSYGEHNITITFDNTLKSQDSYTFVYENSNDSSGSNDSSDSNDDSISTKPPVDSDNSSSSDSSDSDNSSSSDSSDPSYPSEPSDSINSDGSSNDDSNSNNSDNSDSCNDSSEGIESDDGVSSSTPDNVYIISDGDSLDYSGDDLIVGVEDIDLNKDFNFKIDSVKSPIYTVSDGYLNISGSNFNDKDTGTYSAVVSQEDKSISFGIKIKVPVISINKTIGVGTSYRFAFDNKNKIGSISVQSSNKKIATATKGGLIKGYKSGKSKIVYTLRSKNGGVYKININVTVKKGVKAYKATKFESKTYKTDLPVIGVNRCLRKSSYYRIRILDLSDNAKVTYTSSNKKVASVSRSGSVKAKRKGTSFITVKVVQNNKVYYYRYNIIVK